MRGSGEHARSVKRSRSHVVDSRVRSDTFAARDDDQNDFVKRKDLSMTPLMNFVALVARILLAILFVQGGYNKLFGGTAGTVATMASHGIPFPNILVWGAVAVELRVGLCLMAGLLGRCAALVLAAYTQA